MSGSSRKWGLLVILSAIVLAGIIQIPQWVHMRDPEYQGVLVQLNSDEYVYLARVEEALTGRPEQSAEAITGDPRLRGTQPATLEKIIGMIFAPTNWRAATVLQVMDSVTVVLLFLLLFLFLRRCGYSVPQAYTGTVAFSLIELYSLNRPIHQGLSAVLVLSTLILLIDGHRGRIIRGFLGALLLGLTFGDYFWSWSWAWLWYGVFLLFSFHARHSDGRPLLRQAGWFVLVALLIALPFLYELWQVRSDPLFAEALFRSGIRPSHLPESMIYSVIFTIMMATTVWEYFRRSEIRQRYLVTVVSVVTAWIAINQQIVHGQVFNFVSHYLFLLAIAAISVVLFWWNRRTPILFVGAAAAVIYLMALAYDGRPVFSQFFARADRFDEQHFASALPAIDALPRATILSDPETSMFIAGATQHDVVYSLYLKNVLMSHQEIAERYCATQLPVQPDDRHYARHMLIWPDANGAFKDDRTVRIREIALVEEACGNTDRDPLAALQRFGIEYVLWDEKRQPEWNLKRLRVSLKKIAGEQGWSLWSVGR